MAYLMTSTSVGVQHVIKFYFIWDEDLTKSMFAEIRMNFLNRIFPCGRVKIMCKKLSMTARLYIDVETELL